MHPVTFVIAGVAIWSCILIGMFPGILSKILDLTGIGDHLYRHPDGKLDKTLGLIGGLFMCLFVLALIGPKILYFGILLVGGMIAVGIAILWFWIFIGIPMFLWDKLRPILLPNAKPKPFAYMPLPGLPRRWSKINRRDEIPTAPPATGAPGS